VTIDDRLAAAAATIAHMPEAKIRARLEQLDSWTGSPAHIGALEDDLDGGPADETVRFSLDGAAYEMDLNTQNTRAFRKQLTPFIEHARKAGRDQPRRSARTVASRQHSGDIRAWAKDHGISVSERRRIPVSVVEQYHIATQGHCAAPD
jgi:hypothetical protein